MASNYKDAKGKGETKGKDMCEIESDDDDEELVPKGKANNSRDTLQHKSESLIEPSDGTVTPQ